MASSAEREIRDAVVDWWHVHEPSARIIHELPLNGWSASGRVDLAAVFPDYIVTMEIKSERDKLTRLEKQFFEMARRSHDWKIICHDKWFEGEALRGQEWMNWSHREHLWGYPDKSAWSFDRYRVDRMVSAPVLLDYLHRQELEDALRSFGRKIRSGMRQWELLRDINNVMTGRQVVEVVCAALRAREFAEADAVIEKPDITGGDTQ